MGKKTDAPEVQENQTEQTQETLNETQQPDYVTELLTNGTVVLHAKTRDEITDMVNAIPAATRYGAGAVGFNPDSRTYSLRIDLIVKPSES